MMKGSFAHHSVASPTCPEVFRCLSQLVSGHTQNCFGWALVLLMAFNLHGLAQEVPDRPEEERPSFRGGFGPPPDGFPALGGPPPFGFPGPGPGGMPGMPGMREEVKLVEQFDTNADDRLDATERAAARAHFADQRPEREPRGMRRFGPPGRGRDQMPPEPGRELTPDEVESFPDAPLYAPDVLRTLFLEFENREDWEKELADFYNTDVEVPATLTVDGETYPNVGVHFRGASSFFTVGEGRKRSLNLSLDFVDGDQRLYGYRTLNLLNSHADPTYLRTVLYFEIARSYLPAPAANYVRVVINGECWGIYVSTQQFNKDFIDDWFDTRKGARWKVPGSPRGGGGLEYLGEDVRDYREIYDIRSKDKEKPWASLIELCRVLTETPVDELASALEPLLDVDDALKFLALENVFINNDGYWIRASDYNLYHDVDSLFHLVPHDANETFRMPGGPGFRRGPRSEGAGLDPLAGSEDPSKPLLNRLLSVPSIRERYLGYVRHMAERWLDWERLEPVVSRYQELIAADVEADTRKLDSFDAFRGGVTETTETEGFRGPRRSVSLKDFVAQRRAFLLGLPEVRDASLPE